MTVGPILTRLRQATAPLHDRLDSTLRVVDRLSSPEHRATLIEAYARLHSAADGTMRPWLRGVPGLDYSGRRAPGPGSAAPFAALESEAEAFGALYVFEGATLGGRIIHRELAARGVILDDLQFLDPYGDRAGERWRSFVEILEQRGAADPDGVERGAILAFGFAETCLAEQVPA